MNSINPSHITKLGKLYQSNIEKFLRTPQGESLAGKVQLIFTSPPFPLNNKKRYGNLNGQAYMDWLSQLAPHFSKLLKPEGSIVLEIGNAWESGRLVQSLLHLQSLIAFVTNEKSDLRLCQEFICYNPSRLPSPAEWVTVHRIRTVDSFTRLWWMAKSDFPKADNRQVLRPYSEAMKSLLKRKSFNRKPRPSDHTINKTAFLRNNGGSIAPNVVELEQIDFNREIRLPNNVVSFANTSSNAAFLAKCREKKLLLTLQGCLNN